ncbi:MAG: undecaprenyl-phosphate glucose phosphotransferase [Alphaproteobacteria bacterium]|nr:undecaprenyl-phosphate glucose phosphotransferase [Alphaproteobacteria bacterium]
MNLGPNLETIRSDGGSGQAGAPARPLFRWRQPLRLPRRIFAEDARAAFIAAVRLADILVAFLSAVLSYWLRHGSFALSPDYWWNIAIGCLLCANSLEFAQVYSIARIRRAYIGRIATAWTATMLALIAMIYFTKLADEFSRGWVLLWSGAGFVGIILVRVLARACLARCHHRGTLVCNVAVVGDGEAAERLARTIANGGQEEVRVVGIFRPLLRADDPGATAPDIDDLMAMTRHARVDEIAVSLPCAAELGAVLRKLGVVPADVKLCPDLRDLGLFGTSAARIPAALLAERPLAGWRIVVKRSIDIVISAMLILLLAPLMVVIAILIKLDSDGPVLFRQPRVGFNKNPITVYKFRSMHVEAASDPTIPQARRDDPRVTRLGWFLRRLSLDELPQLFNVLSGSMSLVGPRPHAIAHDEKYAILVDWYLARHRVKPGITGWAQINGFRGEVDTLGKMEKRVAHDLFYIDHWSPLFDLRILLKTLVVALNDDNAY